MFSVFECQPTVIGLREELKQLQAGVNHTVGGVH